MRLFLYWLSTCSYPLRSDQLAQGFCHDNDNIAQLEWGPVPEDMSSGEKQSEGDKVETPADEFAMMDVMIVDSPNAEGEEPP